MSEQDVSRRYSLLGALMSVLPVLILVQIVRIQVDPEMVKKLQEKRESTINPLVTVYPTRGRIFDRNGSLLAGNWTVFEVGVELRDVENPEMVAQVVSAVLGVDYKDALVSASLEPSDTAVYSRLIDNVPPEEIEELDALINRLNGEYADSRGKNQVNVEGLVWSPHLGRTYPNKSLASNLIGFVNAVGEGFFGVEERFNDLLKGASKQVRIPVDPTRAKELPKIPDGASLILSIDREIQRAMEEIIDDSVAESGSDSGSLVVIDPRTGEIIAMATTPRLDLNQFWKYSQVFPKDSPFNQPISQSYEPGSVFKVLTMLLALDSGAVKPETVFIDTGVIEVGGAVIYNWNQGAWGPQDMQGCMQHSLNVCLAWVSTQVGPEKFYEYMKAFGIGHVTGIDLAGEASGRLKEPGDNDWYAADLATNAFGQGVAVTPVQMAVAISAAANDGVMMAPQIVKSVVSEGYQYQIDQRILGVPIKKETARTLTEMLARSLEIESSDALITGYRVAGKTGTAEIPTVYGYTSNQTNASFVGWGPVDDPRFLVYVWLEKPTTSPWGSVVAAPVFREAVEKLVILLNLPPDDVRMKLENSK